MLLLLLAAALGDAPPAAPSAAAPPSPVVFVFEDDDPYPICTFEPRALPRREPLPIRRSFEDRIVESASQL